MKNLLKIKGRNVNLCWFATSSIQKQEQNGTQQEKWHLVNTTFIALFYSVPFCSVLFCSVLLCSAPVLFRSALLCSLLFSSLLFFSVTQPMKLESYIIRESFSNFIDFES